jgi:hypothetical protein
MPDSSDPMVIPNLSSKVIAAPEPSKANEPMNILIVKPIPQSAEIPYKLSQFIPFGS